MAMVLSAPDGASFTPVTVTVEVCGALSRAPSLTVHDTVRVVPAEIGCSLSLLKATLCRAAWYSASVARPVSVRTPVLWL